MKIHFDKTIAEAYGIYCAIVLDNILYWVKENEKTNKNYHDGKYWTYNTIKEFSEHLSFMTQKQIRTTIINLREEGLIEVNNFNKTCSRTNWYTMTEKALNIMNNSQDKSIQDDFSKPDEECIVEEDSNCSESKIEESICPIGHYEVPNKANSNAPQGNTYCPTGQNEMPTRANHPNKIPQIINSNNIEKETYKEKESPERQIFDFWNSKRLVKATELNNYLTAVIANLLKSFTLDQLLLSITRYEEIIHSQHYYDHEFTFKQFLDWHNVQSFQDNGVNWINYVKWKNKRLCSPSNTNNFIHNNYTTEQIANCISNLEECEV